MILTHSEMIERWLLHRYHEMPRGDLAMVRSDGVDLTTIANDEINAWFMNLLDEADPALVDPVDIAPLLEFRHLPDGSAETKLPDKCRRLLSIRMAGWLAPAKIVTKGSIAELRQHNRLTRGSLANPVTVIDGRIARVFTPSGDLTVVEATATMIPDDGCYRFSERALSTIVPFDA